MSERVGEAVEGFEQMDVSQLAWSRYLVTSWRNGTTNGHVVDLSQPTCSCEDQQMNRQGEEVCAHIIKANHLADARPDTSEHVLRFLSQEAQGVQEAAERIEQTATSMETFQQSNGTATGAAPAANGSGATVDDPVASMESLLRDAGLDPDDFDLWIDDQYGSLQLATAGYLSDDDFRVLQDVKEGIGMNWDPDSEVNYLKAEDFPEVLG